MEHSPSLSAVVPAKALGHAHIYAYAGLRLGGAVPHGSLPPCGGGTGRGVQHALPLFCICGPTDASQLSVSSLFARDYFLRGTNFALGALSPPLSLSLPR